MANEHEKKDDKSITGTSPAAGGVHPQGGAGSSSGSDPAVKLGQSSGSTTGAQGAGSSPLSGSSSGLGGSSAGSSQSSTTGSPAPQTSRPVGAPTGPTGAGRQTGSQQSAGWSGGQDPRHRSGSGQQGYSKRREDETQGGAQETMEDLQHRAGEAYEDTAEWARERYEEAADWASDQYRRGVRFYDDISRRGLKSGTQRFVQDNPVLVGVVGLAAGLLLGSLLPRTRPEDRAFGRYSDEVREQGLRYARDATRRGRDYAEQAFTDEDPRFAHHESEFRREHSSGPGRA